jgi:hypothetical protein
MFLVVFNEVKKNEAGEDRQLEIRGNIVEITETIGVNTDCQKQYP